MLYHFLHYSTVAKAHATPCCEWNGSTPYVLHYNDHAPIEYHADEVHKARRLHSKRVDSVRSGNDRMLCRTNNPKKNKPCHVGDPVPTNMDGRADVSQTEDSDGFLYNCWVNPRAEEVWVPKVRVALSLN